MDFDTYFTGAQTHLIQKLEFFNFLNFFPPVFFLFFN